MNRTILLLLFTIGIGCACLISYVLIVVLPVSQGWLESSFNATPQAITADHKTAGTSVILRVRQKLPIDPGK
jgi:hypothetical protein